MLAGPELILCAAAWLVPAAGAEKPNPLSEALESAERRLKDGDSRGALLLFRKVLFAVPGQRTAALREKEVSKLLSTRLIEEADRMWDSNPPQALSRYAQAAVLDPEGPVKAAYARRGYKLYQGRWRPRDGIEAQKKEDAARVEARMRQLELPKGFRLVRLGVFRFFTDTDEKSSRFVQMTNALQAHYDEYLRVMRPFYPETPDEGLHVVLFQKEDAYEKYTGSKDTLGLYLPRKGASFFYVTKEGEDFATLLHEVTHQLNHKVTDVIGAPACFEEGFAEYFSVGNLTNGGRKLSVGVPKGERLSRVRESVRTGKGFIPFESLLAARRSGDEDLFYPESYALVHFLMESHPQGRLILYDVFGAAKYNPLLRAPSAGEGDDGDGDEGEGDDEEQDGEPESPSQSKAKGPAAEPAALFPRNTSEILSRYGLTPLKLEDQFKAYIRSLR